MLDNCHCWATADRMKPIAKAEPATKAERIEDLLMRYAKCSAYGRIARSAAARIDRRQVFPVRFRMCGLERPGMLSHLLSKTDFRLTAVNAEPVCHA